MINPQDINLKELKVNSASYNPYNKLKFDIMGEDAVKQFLSDKLNRIENEIDKLRNYRDGKIVIITTTTKIKQIIRREFTLKWKAMRKDEVGL